MRNRFFLTTSLCLILCGTGLAAADDELLARRLINSQGCKACHRLGGDGGRLANRLDDVGLHLTATQLEDRLFAPDQRHAGARLPSFSHLEPSQQKALAAFLATQQTATVPDTSD